jgi:hypothetical protein
MRVMLAAETQIPVITTNFYDNPWECLEGYGNITPRKKFNAKRFPEGIPARSGGMATRYELLHNLAFVTMAEVVLGGEGLSQEDLWRGLIRENKVFSLRQALGLVSRGFTGENNAPIKESYRTNNFFFVEAEEDYPCVVVASPNIGNQRFILRTLPRVGGGMTYGNYGNLFVPASST